MKNSPAINFEAFYNSCKIDLRELISSEVSKAVHQALSQILAEQQCNSAVLLKETEVLKMYKISKSFLRKLRKEDALPYIKIGDSVRFEKLKLDEFFAKYNK